MLQISKSPCTTSRLRIGMGTFIAVDAEASTDLGILSGIDAAFAAIALVEALMHPTRPGSDLVAIHQTELGTAVPIHAWTWEILMLSKRLNRASQGIFDPCLPEMAGRFIDLEFTAARCVIAHAPLRIDLGGIAKGYAVDRAVTALRAAGCHGDASAALLETFGARVIKGPLHYRRRM
jgi:thiamine biosynthesis lipoprotein